MGLDKWHDGLMYSVLLCTRKNGNNSAVRRRPVAFADKPATESSANLERLLHPIHGELSLLKDNTSILVMNINGIHRCVPISCDFQKKHELDTFWSSRNQKPASTVAHSMNETEQLKRKTNWNIANHDIDKIYIVEGITDSNKFYMLPAHQYPEFFVCIIPKPIIEHVYVMKKNKQLNATTAQYELLGVNKIWGADLQLEQFCVLSNQQAQFIPFNSQTVTIDVLYLAVHDGGDLSGFDSRYNMGNHACTYFCKYCQHKNSTASVDTPYRTTHSINHNANRYFLLTTGRVPVPKPESELQASRGISGIAPDPYPGASRITPPSLHIDMGIISKIYHQTTSYIKSLDDNSVTQQRIDHHFHQMNVVSANCRNKRKEMNKYKYYKDNLAKTIHIHGLCINELDQKLNVLNTEYSIMYNEYKEHEKSKENLAQLLQSPVAPNYYQQYTVKLGHYRICANRCFDKSLEGNRAREYRLKFAIITSPIAPSNYYRYMCQSMKYYNQLMHLLNKSTNTISKSDCTKAEQILQQYYKHWQYTKRILNLDLSLGAKYHYLKHCVEYIHIWRIPLGYINEQSIEAFHKICSMVLQRYYNQRGILKIKYAMRQLMVITSPLYHD